MKDPKNIVITILLALVLFLGGYILGQKTKPEVAVKPEITKEYKRKVARSFGDHFKALQSCYIAYLDKGPALKEGKVEVNFTVNDDGNITKVTTKKNEFSDPDIANCLAEKVEAITLLPPPPGAGETFEHAFVFKSEETVKRELEDRKNLFPKVLPVQ